MLLSGFFLHSLQGCISSSPTLFSSAPSNLYLWFLADHFRCFKKPTYLFILHSISLFFDPFIILVSKDECTISYPMFLKYSRQPFWSLSALTKLSQSLSLGFSSATYPLCSGLLRHSDFLTAPMILGPSIAGSWKVPPDVPQTLKIRYPKPSSSPS